jgi:hypothetical protein
MAQNRKFYIGFCHAPEYSTDFAIVGKWKEQAIHQHLRVKDACKGAIFVFKDFDKTKVIELL